MTLRLLSWNIRYGGVGREEALAAGIRACEPDLVVLQEATRPEVVQRLSMLTGLATYGSRRGRSLAFLSRVPIGAPVWRRPFWCRHAFLDLTVADGAVRIIGVHLSAIHAAWTERRRGLELQSLLRAVRSSGAGFHLLTGDFNTLAPGERLDMQKLPPRLRPFVWLSGGSIRWRTVASVLEAGYVDGWRARHPDGPAQPTFPTWDPHLRLDYVFVPAHHAPRLVQCDVVTDGREPASDHFPLLSVIDAAPAA